MPLRLNYFFKFDSKELDEISQCPATARLAVDARRLWHHFYVARLSDACASDECNSGSFRATRDTWVLRLYFGGAGTFRRRVVVAGAFHARCCTVVGDRDGLADVEGRYAA